MAVGRLLVAGRYRLCEPVGTGGMGRVWLARDEMLDRDVAVKELVPPQWMTEGERSGLRHRTLREARSAARLNHPHVVHIYDVAHDDGQPWIVMEYVASRSLHQVINEDGPFSPTDAAQIGLAVLDGLAAAHRAGVLHRDVKPHNVLIGTDGRVVLTDFGLATFADDPTVTGPGLVVGSPQYVSPERARDGASTVESDLWSFGATLYAAVEGRSPYTRATAMATLIALATEPPDPPRRAGPLEPVLTGLLQRAPGDRLTTVEVERRLRLIVGSTADRAVPLPSPRRSPESAVVLTSQIGVKGERVGGHGDVAAEDRTSRGPVVPAHGDAPRSWPGRGAGRRLRDVSGEDTGSWSAAGEDAGPRPAPEEAAWWATDERPAVTSRPIMLFVLGTVLAALLAVGTVAVYRIHQGDDRGGSPTPWAQPTGSGSASARRQAPTGGFPAVACNARAPITAPKTPQPNAVRGVNGWELVRGWSYFTDGSGVHLPVPDGWTIQKVGTAYCFRSQVGHRVLTLAARTAVADPVMVCRIEAARLVEAGLLPHYQQLLLQSRPLLYRAADWEFRYADANGVLQHAQTRWLVANGKTYVISWSTAEADWIGDRPNMIMALSTFYADGKR